MYRKSLLCLFAAGAFAISCGDDDPPSGDGGSPDRGGSAGKGGTSGKGGSSGTDDGGEPGTGGTGKGGAAGKGGTSGSSGTAGGGGGDAEPCEEGDAPQCSDSSTIILCDPEADSTLQAFTCDDFCSTLGLESGDCVEDGADTTCDCGDPVDEECFAGAEEVCSCLQGTEIECLTDGDRFAWYKACVDGEADEEIVRCFAEGSMQVCSRSIEDCVP
jgi:hypothetical protein